ncbi:hypothetical protein D3C73_1360230 [compost metagenome]
MRLRPLVALLHPFLLHEPVVISRGAPYRERERRLQQLYSVLDQAVERSGLQVEAILKVKAADDKSAVQHLRMQR